MSSAKTQTACVMPSPSRIAMDDEWAEVESETTPERCVTVSLAVAQSVRGYIAGDAFDTDLIEEFLRAVEKVDPR